MYVYPMPNTQIGKTSIASGVPQTRDSGSTCIRVPLVPATVVLPISCHSLNREMSS
jgi:hypothetical protein